MNTFEKGRALVIGIADYDVVSKLPSTILSDARDIATLLKDPTYCVYSAENVRCLLDAAATKSTIVSELALLASSTGTDDTVVIYFSGHGAQR